MELSDYFVSALSTTKSEIEAKTSRVELAGGGIMATHLPYPHQDQAARSPPNTEQERSQVQDCRRTQASCLKPAKPTWHPFTEDEIELEATAQRLAQAPPPTRQPRVISSGGGIAMPRVKLSERRRGRREHTCKRPNVKQAKVACDDS